MNVHVVENTVTELNLFPAEGGISKDISTLTIIPGNIFPDYNILTL